MINHDNDKIISIVYKKYISKKLLYNFIIYNNFIIYILI